ncbi:SDR family NAD(P)-dependent oxidoreductase [Oceanobacillus alkalisoli]|uniref:SDR family NAD(P)-dependent oxidoreductase n=1 Tax=Oceanobacillus alkalisoli TaxID=2925113 RepID=UPI001EEFBDAB|nr:SDR family oxidoreductase [Oceanobacillus alkalisoli]MCF3944558.1 SDR family oxidoreductase [Oceanobacillus alkalisoli]MCG5102226.1 SDR family oxidoreductase [Oceanobacillus alkalisoli]
MTFKTKTIIVTGAGGGMGKATVESLLEEGANVIGCDLNVAALSELEDNPRFQAVAGDLLDEAAVQHIFEEAKRKFGSVDGLANVHGIAQSATPIEECSLSEYRKIIDVNMTSIFLTCREAAKYMKGQGSGKIVNIGSVSVTRPRPGLQAYVASKGAVESFTKALALELAPHHVTANVLHPGPADTSMLGEFTAEGGSVDDTKKEVFESSVPLGRLLQPADIAKSVKYLLSDSAEMITGAVLHVDGGRNI